MTVPTQPPPKVPSMWEMRKLVLKGEIDELSWPCTFCFGAGCDTCDGTGVGSRAGFATWYARLCAERERQLKAFIYQLDLDSQEVVGENFYDLERLRKMGSKGS